MARLIWSFLAASSSIFGTRPQVLRLMWRMEIFMPSGWFTSSRKRMTLSKLSSGSPMPMSTMWEMGRPESICVNSTSSSISKGSKRRTSPPMVDAQKAQPMRQPTSVEMQTVFP